MKIKLFLYSVCFICSLTGIQQVSADGHGERDIGGTVKFFLSGGVLSHSLQTIDYKDKDVSDPTTSGSGIVLDINLGRGNHAIALDYYAFTEVYSITTTEDTIDSDDNVISSVVLLAEGKEEYNALLLGYRYHFNSGFYIGGGILSINSPTITQTVDLKGAGKLEAVGKFESAQPLALTLGYDHVFASGFTIGAHLLRSASINSKLDSVSLSISGVPVVTSDDASDFDIKEGIIQSLGLGIGYSW